MEINKKLKIFSVTIAILAIILSVITTVYKPEIRSQGKTPEEIAIELEEQQKLDTVMADIRKTLQVNDICDSYIKLCSDTLDVNDAIKTKKAELLSEAQNLKTKAKEFGSEAEGIYNSPALCPPIPSHTQKNAFSFTNSPLHEYMLFFGFRFSSPNTKKLSSLFFLKFPTSEINEYLYLIFIYHIPLLNLH